MNQRCSICLPISASASIPLSSLSESTLDLPAVFRTEKLVCRDMTRDECSVCAARAVREKDAPGFVEEPSPAVEVGC